MPWLFGLVIFLDTSPRFPHSLAIRRVGKANFVEEIPIVEQKKRPEILGNTENRALILEGFNQLIPEHTLRDSGNYPMQPASPGVRRMQIESHRP